MKLKDFLYFNPKENLKKGTIAKKVPMERLLPFTRKIDGFEYSNFSGGTKFRNGDTLLARITPCLENGKTVMVSILDDGEVAFGSTEYIVLREKEGISDKNFIYYLATSPCFRKIAIKSMIGTSGRQRVQQDVLKNADFNLPPIEEQRKIAGILGALDDKIELNEKINQNLEAQAQAIFKSWFVDFEPFGGKMPKDWKLGAIGDIAEIVMGQSPDGRSYNDVKIGCTFFQGRAEFGKRFPQVRLYTTEPKKMAKKNDVLLSVRAPVGDFNIALDDCCIGRGLSAIRSKTKYQSFILYTIWTSRKKLDLFNGEGTVFGSINKNALTDLEVIIPSTEIMRKFEDIASSLDKKIQKNFLESTRLAELRDALLPKLMSGEIDVSNIEI